MFESFNFQEEYSKTSPGRELRNRITLIEEQGKRGMQVLHSIGVTSVVIIGFLLLFPTNTVLHAWVLGFFALTLVTLLLAPMFFRQWVEAQQRSIIGVLKPIADEELRKLFDAWTTEKYGTTLLDMNLSFDPLTNTLMGFRYNKHYTTASKKSVVLIDEQGDGSHILFSLGKELTKQRATSSKGSTRKRPPAKTTEIAKS